MTFQCICYIIHHILWLRVTRRLAELRSYLSPLTSVGFLNLTRTVAIIDRQLTRSLFTGSNDETNLVKRLQYLYFNFLLRSCDCMGVAKYHIIVQSFYGNFLCNSMQAKHWPERVIIEFVQSSVHVLSRETPCKTWSAAKLKL